MNATPSGATQMTAEQFANGVATALLNGTVTDTVWAQTVGIDLYPRFKNAQTVYGDLNGDKNIDAVDLIALRRILVSASTDFSSNISGDVNKDSKIDLRDIVRLKKYLAGMLG